MTSRTWTGQDRMLWRNFVMQNKNQTGSQSWQSLHQSFRKISPSMLQRTWSRCTCSLLNLSHPSTTDTYKLPGSALLPMLEVEMSKSWPKFVWCSEDLFVGLMGLCMGFSFVSAMEIFYYFGQMIYTKLFCCGGKNEDGKELPVSANKEKILWSRPQSSN